MDLEKELSRLEDLFFDDRCDNLKVKLGEISKKLEKEIKEKVDFIGKKILNITLLNEFEMEVELHNFTLEKPSILYFSRGDWCPYSNINTKFLIENSDKLINKGYNVVIISNSLPKEGISLQSRVNLPVSVLTDLSSLLADSLGITYELTEDLKGIYSQVGLTPEYGRENLLIFPSLLTLDNKSKVKDIIIRSDQTYLDDIEKLIEDN